MFTITDCGPPEGDGSVRFNFSTTTFESEATVTYCGSPEGNGFVRFDYTTTTFESEANVTCNDGYENPIPARVTCQASGKWEEATCTIKDCGSPEVDGSVRFDYTTTTFESEATVSCNDGYENPIPARITCRASGKWEEATCKIKDCGSPKGDGSVRFDYTATTFESEATVLCNAGYKNPIPAKITCQASGKWEEATCKIKDCGSPKGDGSVRFDYATTTFESEASVSCKDGYKNPIPARITCRASGKWEEATCKIKDCGPPEGDGSVRFDYTTTTFDSEASISCKAGYENPIPAKITCQASGKWEEATCKIKDCGPPEGDGSVRFNFSTTTFESEATVTCNDGYENPTPPRITCQASGKWEEAKCTIKDCGSPEGNGFVRFDYTTTTFESEANVTCNDGYENPIPARVTCQASGKWEEATCTIKDCGSPEGDGSVRFDYTTTTFESEANVTCNDGYKNPIPARITCQASGKWEEATYCGSPKGDGSVRFDYTATTFESEASVSCNDGYENPIPAKITCQASGKWEEAIYCGSPKGDGSVRFDYTTTTFESEATVTCNDGYENPIPAKITCQASGKWEEATYCGSPKGDGSVRFDYTATTFESEATVSCNDGYENPIPAKITCQASGKWEEATYCGSPEGDGSVRFDYTTTTFESEATVSCNDGYENPIPAKITCQASGKWEEATYCGSPKSDGSVRFDYTATIFESEATVSCNDGYENPIPARITCQASGKWEEATYCGSPKSDGSVRFDYTATIFESEATVSCNDGYENPIPARITCQASGKWEEATCTIIDCGSPKGDGSVRFDYTATTIESEATVSCNDGYENPIPAKITCQASGKWEEATCKIKDCGSPEGDGSVRFDYTTTTFESEATVTCNDGFINPSTERIRCQASGEWEKATCLKDLCAPSLPTISNGGVTRDSNTAATVKCDAGYRPSTFSEAISCEESSGSWTPHVTCDLICNNPNEVTVDGTRYRLCDGDGSGSNGRLEVYVEGEWGTVCSDYWQRENYNFEVTCRMFGYRDGKEASFTQGWGSILMDNVYCRTDSVNSLIDCFRGYVYWTFNVMYTFTPFGEYTTSTTTYLTYYFSSYYELGEHNCNHRKDVGISCYS
ncbi:sushi, von Willebrand factor type A, EGF and pentraxin domain-containing protein 1-like [Mercenaria mercenaria]|uniref:sushi, von Willebrand factor type A, EGF and pentraxin domain-containing protein 1-like n=1 Tax=Mercenaria mercenaria TaxID=6596 RepID=UPI00234E828D|nr:sushi, von Willebrand factor type A, EGF and pentraxin domain-containing protein 1-like [Mercenaria mercenaria]